MIEVNSAKATAFLGLRHLSIYAFIAKTSLQSRVRLDTQNDGNVYNVTKQITFPIPKFARKEVLCIVT